MALFDLSAVIESYAVVILNRSVPLVGKFDLAARKCVDLIDLKHLIQLGCCLIETCSLDEGTFAINQIDRHDCALATGILPRAHLGFLDESGLDDPVCAELIESLDWHVGISWQLLTYFARTHQIARGDIRSFTTLISLLSLVSVSAQSHIVKCSCQFPLIKVIIAFGDPQVIAVSEVATLFVLRVILGCSYLLSKVPAEDLRDVLKDHYSTHTHFQLNSDETRSSYLTLEK